MANGCKDCKHALLPSEPMMLSPQGLVKCELAPQGQSVNCWTGEMEDDGYKSCIFVYDKEKCKFELDEETE